MAILHCSESNCVTFRYEAVHTPHPQHQKTLELANYTDASGFRVHMCGLAGMSSAKNLTSHTNVFNSPRRVRNYILKHFNSSFRSLSEVVLIPDIITTCTQQSLLEFPLHFKKYQYFV